LPGYPLLSGKACEMSKLRIFTIPSLIIDSYYKPDKKSTQGRCGGGFGQHKRFMEERRAAQAPFISHERALKDDEILP